VPHSCHNGVASGGAIRRGSATKGQFKIGINYRRGVRSSVRDAGGAFTRSRRANRRDPDARTRGGAPLSMATALVPPSPAGSVPGRGPSVGDRAHSVPKGSGVGCPREAPVVTKWQLTGGGAPPTSLLSSTDNAEVGGSIPPSPTGKVLVRGGAGKLSPGPIRFHRTSIEHPGSSAGVFWGP
jgi:hypothetical protein